MAINELQLPPLINFPKVDFSGLDKIGDALQQARQNRATAGLVDAFLPTTAPATVPTAPAPPAAPQGVPLNNLGGAANAIAKVESGGNYGALGPPTASGDRAFGKYQVMGANIPQWTQEVLGKALTPEQFLASPQAQDAVFNAKFGQYAQKYGPEGAARAWFAGEGGMNDFGRKDVNGVSVADYGQKFNNALALAPQTQPPAMPPGMAATAPQQPGGAPIPPGAIPQPQQTTTAPQPAAQSSTAIPPQAAPAVIDAAAQSGLNPAVAQRLKAAILAGGSAQQYALGILGKYVVPQFGFQPLPDGTVVRTNSRDGTVTPVYQSQKPFGFQPLPDGTIVRTDSVRGTVTPAYESSGKPIAVKPGETLISPRTMQPVYSNNTGSFDANTLTTLADQYIAGDKGVLQNLGRGPEASQNIIALRNRIASRMAEKGISPEQQAVRMAEYAGTIASEKTLGARQANIEMAVTEAQQLAPQVLATSAAVNRTNYPSLNKILLAAKTGTGDPEVVKFGIALNSFVNVYSRAINPGGSPTVSDKEHARELLNDAWSVGQIQSAVGQLQREMALAQKSPEMVRKAIRDSRAGTAEGTAPQNQTRLPLPQGVSPASVVADAKTAWPQATPEQRAAIAQKAKQYGLDLSMYGLK